MARIGGRPRMNLEGGSEENSGLYVQALSRGLSILALFDVEHPEWSLGQICRETGLSKTTAYRMLRTMEYKGFVVFNPDTEIYCIGPAIIPPAYLAVSNTNFSRLTHPTLERLAAATGETVELAVAGKEEAVVVDHVATSHPFKPNLPIGRVLRNISNSGMKIFAAYGPDEERERILNEHHVSLTPNTITDQAQLRNELEKVIAVGVAYDMEEQDLGVCAVSAPVFGNDNEVRAVVTVVAPVERFGPNERNRNTEAVKKAALELSACINQSRYI